MATEPTIIACRRCGKRNRVRAHPTATPRCASCTHALAWVVDADAGSFAEEIRAAVPVVVDFWAPWCGPCRMVSPVLERLAERHAGRLKVVKLNVDEAPELAAEYRTMSIPTLAVIRGGREIDRVVGALPEAQLQARLAPYLDGRAGPA